MKKVIVITGGSDGLGKATAKLLAGENTVVILSPNPDKTKAAAQEIGCDYEIADVSNWESLQKAAKNIISKHKRIDVLVNNAGLWIFDELEKNDPEQIKQVLEVNTLGVILATKAVIPQMKNQASGLIININSQGGIYAKAKRSVYQASKWAITGFTKCLEPELKVYGIRVTGVYPGKMDTKLFEKVGDVGKNMTDALQPEEVAETIKYLVSLPEHITLPEIGIKHLKG